MARLSGRFISLTWAMPTAPARWAMMRRRAMADAMASGSALMTISQRSSRLMTWRRRVTFWLSLREEFTIRVP